MAINIAVPKKHEANEKVLYHAISQKYEISQLLGAMNHAISCYILDANFSAIKPPLPKRRQRWTFFEVLGMAPSVSRKRAAAPAHQVRESWPGKRDWAGEASKENVGLTWLNHPKMLKKYGWTMKTWAHGWWWAHGGNQPFGIVMGYNST